MRIGRLLSVFLGCLITSLASAVEPVTCVLQPSQVAELGSRESGIVEQIAVTRSAWVEKGAPILSLDSGLLAIDQRRQQRVIESLAGRVAKNEALASSQLIAGDELEELQTNLDLARIDLARLQQLQARLMVRAPFSGYVADIYVSPGELVADQPVVQLIDTQTLRAEMSVIDADFGTLRPGDVLVFSFDLVSERFEGTVTAVGPAIDPESNTFRLTAQIDNADGVLTAGMSCSIVDEPSSSEAGN